LDKEPRRWFDDAFDVGCGGGGCEADSSDSIEECEWDIELEDLEDGPKLSSRLPTGLPRE
jgi:hypothetical protein